MSGGERVVVSQAAVEDAGIYRCLAVNLAGQDSKLIKLEVYAPPRINVSAIPSHIMVLHKGKEQYFELFSDILIPLCHESYPWYGRLLRFILKI